MEETTATLSSHETPGEIAANEAARQAVILAFGLTGAIVVMLLQRQIMRELMPDSVTLTQRIEAALARERRWGKAAVRLWQAGFLRAARWAEDRAQRARREYESLRP